MSRSSSNLYCQELADILAECESGEPDEQAVERMERHIEECAICQSAESMLSASLNRLQRDHQSDELKPSFEARLADLLCRKGESQSSSER